MDVWIAILLSVFLTSIVSLVGVFTLALRQEVLRRLLRSLVAFASGTLLATAFLDLLPEAAELDDAAMGYALMGIVLFFVIEGVIRWHHCHEERCEVHPFTYLNLLGDGVHNFIDGAIIAAAYLTSFELGVITTFAILLHEVPQEISDFGILIYGGFSRKKALLFNFLTALISFLGAGMALVFSSLVEELTPALLGLAAGGFIYIATTDLMPELQRSERIRDVFSSLIVLIAGMGTVQLLAMLFEA
ncbi:MAG: ZIP family metal transporter [Euryarchaeota archaeon]|nr:ZIP family metal transporter [Euryarchaeota archaeon]